MQHSTTVAGSILAVGIFAAWTLIDQSLCESRAARYEPSSFNDKEFRMSWRAYMLPVIGLGACVWLWVSATTTHAPNLCRAITIIFALLACFVIFSYRRMRFLISNGKVSYIEGKKTVWTFSLSEIREVRIIGSRSGPKLAIFLINKEKYYSVDLGFEQNSLLIAMLRKYRPNV
jgi:hypothetical protein